MLWAVRCWLLCAASFSPVLVFAQTADTSPGSTVPTSGGTPVIQNPADPEFPFARPLPEGVAPNPPQPLYLKGKDLVWRGEYEFDKLSRPLLDTNSRPIPILYTKKGRRVRPAGIQLLKTHPASIEDGTLMVDGWTSKARLNYDIQDLRYLYVSVPSLGTFIISPVAFPGGELQATGFDDKILNVRVDTHEVQLATVSPILGKKTAQPAWVKLDTSFVADRRYPIVGYGDTLVQPFTWPGARIAKDGATARTAPPLPSNMLPRLLKPACYVQPDKSCDTPEKPAPGASPALAVAH